MIFLQTTLSLFEKYKNKYNFFHRIPTKEIPKIDTHEELKPDRLIEIDRKMREYRYISDEAAEIMAKDPHLNLLAPKCTHIIKRRDSREG
jgi:hypothetical protein